MTSKATRIARRKRRNEINLAGGAVAAPKPHRAHAPKGEDPRKSARSARIKQLIGNRMSVTDAERDAMSELAGCCVGRRILVTFSAPEPRRMLWAAAQHMRRTWAAYDRAIGAPSRHAKSLGILLPTDEFSADASTPSRDTRTDEQKQRDAVMDYMAVEGWLGYVDKPARSAAINSVVDDAPIHDWPGVLAALQCVSEGAKGNKIIWRWRIGAPGTQSCAKKPYYPFGG